MISLTTKPIEFSILGKLYIGPWMVLGYFAALPTSQSIVLLNQNLSSRRNNNLYMTSYFIDSSNNKLLLIRIKTKNTFCLTKNNILLY